MDSSDSHFRLSHKAVFAGTVVDAATGKPVNDFRLRVLRGRGISSSWTDAGYSFSDTNGRWKMQNIDLSRSARLELEVRAKGYAPQIVKNAMATNANDTTEIVFRMTKAATLTGSVLDSKSQRIVRNARLTLIELLHPFGRGTTWGKFSRYTCTSDEHGNYQFDDLPGGRFRVLVEHDDYLPLLHGPLQIARAARTALSLQLGSPGRINGVLQDETGTALATGTISLKPSRLFIDRNNRRHSQVTTDEKGRFHFSELAQGPYWLEATAVDKQGTILVYQSRIDVFQGKESKTELRPAGACAIMGTIRFLEAKSRPQTLRLRRSVPGIQEYQSFQVQPKRGSFSIRGLPAGRYRLTVFFSEDGKPGFYNAEESVTLTSTVTRRLDLLIASIATLRKAAARKR